MSQCPECMKNNEVSLLNPIKGTRHFKCKRDHMFRLSKLTNPDPERPCALVRVVDGKDTDEKFPVPCPKDAD